jgi:hypothetical protein
MLGLLLDQFSSESNEFKVCIVNRVSINVAISVSAFNQFSTLSKPLIDPLINQSINYYHSLSTSAM